MAINAFRNFQKNSTDRHATEASCPDLTRLSETDKDRLIAALFARVDTVEAKLYMKSDNSSKPPLSDVLARQTSSLRESSGKKAGGQKGRKGTTLRVTEWPDEVVNHSAGTV